MTDRVSIVRNDDDPNRPGPWWRPFGPAPVVRCACGHRSQMRDHSIDDDGTVSPSILCPDCGWHVWGVLEGWTP